MGAKSDPGHTTPRNYRSKENGALATFPHINPYNIKELLTSISLPLPLTCRDLQVNKVVKASYIELSTLKQYVYKSYFISISLYTRGNHSVCIQHRRGRPKDIPK